MDKIDQTKNILGIIAAGALLIAFGALYLYQDRPATIAQEVEQASPELDTCLKKVQKKVAAVTVELNDWFADPESENYDNSTVWDDVAALAEKDREKCYSEFN